MAVQGVDSTFTFVCHNLYVKFQKTGNNWVLLEKTTFTALWHLTTFYFRRFIKLCCKSVQLVFLSHFEKIILLKDIRKFCVQFIKVGH